MKTGIIGILNNPACSLNSHSAGWNMIVKDLIDPNADFLTEKEAWGYYERLIICHGPNYKEGSYNIIGGIQDSTIDRCNKLNNFNGKIMSIDNFDPNDFYKKRNLNLKFTKQIEKITLPKKDKIVYGDSHSISVWPNREYEINRNDGKTLHGFLKNQKNFNNYKDVILYFGNIDIRFHLCRQPNPLRSAVELFERYINYAKKYNATITHLLPIENENRKIPKSGQYKGQNYFGTREQRQTLVHIVNDLMDKSGLNVINWPEKWYDDIDYFQKKVMEPKQSVHLRPKYYKKNIKTEQVSLF